LNKDGDEPECFQFDTNKIGRQQIILAMVSQNTVTVGLL